MVSIANRSRYFLDIDPELRNRFKAEAALQGKTMKEWMIEAIIEKLEDDIDIREGLATLKDKEGTITLEEYIKSRREG